MTSSRHLIDDDLYDDIIATALEFGYKTKGKNSYQKLLQRLLDYSKIHPDLFRL